MTYWSNLCFYHESFISRALTYYYLSDYRDGALMFVKNDLKIIYCWQKKKKGREWFDNGKEPYTVFYASREKKESICNKFQIIENNSIRVEFDFVQLQGRIDEISRHCANRARSLLPFPPLSGEEEDILILARNFSHEINQPDWIQRCCISHPSARCAIRRRRPLFTDSFHDVLNPLPRRQERKIRKRK